ncbi:MAG TPA: cellulase [Rhodanobacteraceae bacterium]
MQRRGHRGFWLRPSGWMVLLVALAAGTSACAADHYRWRNVAIEGGGYVTGVVCHPKVKGLCYARTDVGGAYEWLPAARRWVSMTDWIGAKDSNLIGIEAIALDPSDPGRVYLAAGTYTSKWAGNAAIFRSRDRGAHIQRVDLPFKLGANEQGRGNGPRLAVDPNDGSVLFFGTPGAGLWRSGDHGAHWQKVGSFPAVATSPSASVKSWRVQPIGIVAVAFDPSSGKQGAPTPVIYAAVSTSKTSLFRSSDGGKTWRAVPGQPTGLRPSHIHRSSDGSFYLVYGDQPGPDNMNKGAIWRYQPHAGKQGTWTDISPLPTWRTRFGWGDVAVSASNPAVLMASTMHDYKPHDMLFRSTDYGKHWKKVFVRSRFNLSGAPWTRGHRPHWMTTVVIDPFNPDHVMFTTGYGIWASLDMRQFDHGGKVTWWFQDRGLEETVPLALASPPKGAHLLSGLGDIDGFRHDHLDAAGLEYTAPPRLTNTESLAFAGQKPLLVVRSGTIRDWQSGQVRAAWSKDGGQHWQTFANEPPGSDGAGSITLTADGSAVLWAPLHAKTVQLTRDFGRHWQVVEGLPGGVQVLCDRIDAQRCYAFNPRDGALYASHDGGVSFAAIGGALGEAARGHQHVQLKVSPRKAGVLYLSAQDLPLLRGNAQGQASRTLPGITGSDAFGFGKPAPGHQRPTLFVAGRLNGQQGIYRSIDGGQHWQRINDDAHRYGRISHLTGDPRVFGRVYLATSGRGIIYGQPTGGTP